MTIDFRFQPIENSGKEISVSSLQAFNMSSYWFSVARSNEFEDLEKNDGLVNYDMFTMRHFDSLVWIGSSLLDLPG